MHLFCLFAIIFSSSSLAHSHPNNASDQQSLLPFKHSITYDPYSSLDNWNSSVNVCDWTGVQCSLWNQRVIALNLSGMDLQGSISPFLANISFLELLEISNNTFHGHIPPQLGYLPQLRELVLHGNSLGGSIPTTFSALHNLVVLSLSHNHLSGSIPAELAVVTNLQILDLGLNNLTGYIPPSLGNLRALIQLDLGENNLHGVIPPSVSNYTLLERLVLMENQISGHIPSEFGAKLPNLQELHLWGNKLTGNIPISLTNCSQLRLLYLNENQLSGIVPAELGKLVFLESLYIHANQLGSPVTLPFLTALVNCSRLQKIDVSNNPLGGVLPPSIAHLSNKLTFLDLSNASIQGTIPQEIANLTSLTYLALADNLLDGSIPSEFKRLQKLERLRLRNNKLVGSIPSEIFQLRNLGSLSLRKNMLSGPIPQSLGNLQQLRRLLLSENLLSGKIPSSLGKCRLLELLDLSYNRLTGNIPLEVGNLPNLQFCFNLSNNFLQGSLPPELGRMTMVQTIDISSNRLTGRIPDALGSCAGLFRLFLSHNALQGPIPHSIGELKSLENLDVSSNNLSGAIPNSLGKLKMLHNVNVSFNNLRGEIPKEGIFANITNTSFMGNPGLCGPQMYLPACPTSTIPEHTNYSLPKRVIILVASVSAFILCCLLVGFFWKYNLDRKKYNLDRKSSSLSRTIPLKRGHRMVSYEDLVIATNRFNDANLLGVGSFGSVYKGILSNGTIVAVKVLNLQNEAACKSFITECKVLGRIRHRNLIRVISYCSDIHLKALVLELMSNGSLEKHLYPVGDASHSGDVCGLSLGQRLSIAIDIAHGMAYLHHHCLVQVVHCDLKPSNILLDENMTAHLCDFGIAQLTCANSLDSFTSTLALKGSIGYIAPEYGLGKKVSTKGDVYSFGIVLLEMMTRKRPTNNMFVEGLDLPKWVNLAFPHRELEVVDSSLLSTKLKDVSSHAVDQHRIFDCAIQLILVGLQCTRELPEDRPSMTEVVRVLDRIKRALVGASGTSKSTIRYIIFTG